MTALMFGAGGQDGQYLTSLLNQQGCKVIGISRHGDYLHTDITNYDAIEILIEQYETDLE